MTGARLVQLEIPTPSDGSESWDASNSPHPIHGPRHPRVHLFDSDDLSHVLLADASRVYEIPRESFDALNDAITDEDVDAADRLLADLGLQSTGAVRDEPAESGRIHALSLAVAQKCNLGCTYCYAEGGSFGGPASNMSLDVATQAVDCMLDDSQSGDRFTLAFLGGEPLVNREVLRAATEYASDKAARKNVRVNFSITSNGTLLDKSDAEFFERHGFGVTISLDGIGETHDRQRPFQGGSGSYERILGRVQPALEKQRRMQVSARVTVTPRNLELKQTLDELLRLGFHSVGFSPMLSSPTGRDQMQTADFDVLLEQMIECGQEFERRISDGKRYAFSNMATAMKEIHKGTHRPYPCGAGAGYFGVSADGELSACHRFVNEPVGLMGSLDSGIDLDRQTEWLTTRHVHSQSPCSDCWARYLCGGGCHHEVISRGRPACDYIRGWLHYCLQAYVRLSSARPDYFES